MKKILLIESDEVVAGLIQYQLHEAGYAVEWAPDAASSQHPLEHFKPDLIVLDLMLSDRSGVRVLKRLRSSQGSRLPVLVLNNSYDSKTLREAKLAGATEFLNKAEFGSKTMTIAIARLLQQAPPSLETSPAASAASTAAHQAPETPPVAPPETEPALPEPERPPPETAPAEPASKLELLAEAKRSAPETAAKIRSLAHAALEEHDKGRRDSLLRQAHSICGEFSGRLAIAEFAASSRLCLVLEALLGELLEKPQRINPSNLSTQAQTADFISTTLDREDASQGNRLAPPRVASVDDDVVSRKIIAAALKRAQLECTSIEDPLMALGWLQRERYDLIILDVSMPDMDGFALCRKLRLVPHHQETPILFVTALESFENRLRSAQVGGTDFIGKPFLGIELAAKSLNLIMQSRFKLNKRAFQSFSPGSPESG